MSSVLKGVVKWFNNAKGFGFIEHTSGKDVFVHYSVIESEGYKSLKDGETVEYELQEGAKGMHAVKVNRVNPPEPSAKRPMGEPIKYDAAPETAGDSSGSSDSDDDTAQSEEATA